MENETRTATTTRLVVYPDRRGLWSSPAHEEPRDSARNEGWRTGLEPATTGTTTRGSTN
jgi:hypothetical protein